MEQSAQRSRSGFRGRGGSHYNGRREDKKKKYGDHHKRSDGPQGDFEHQGILATCTNKNEKAAIRDLYRILNDFAGVNDDEGDAQLGKRNEDDEEKPKKREKPFQQMRMNAKGMLFVIMNKSLLEKMTALALSKKILDSIETSKELLTRFVSRIYPIDYAMNASLANFDSCVQKLVEKYLPELPNGQTATWCLRFKCRSNSKFTRQQFLDTILKYIPACYHFIQYKADREFFVDITQHTMCVSVLSPYSDDRYYSFQKCVEAKPNPPNQNASKGEHDDSYSDIDSQYGESGDNESGKSKTGENNKARNVQKPGSESKAVAQAADESEGDSSIDII